MFCYLFSINWEEVILETYEKKIKSDENANENNDFLDFIISN